MKPLSKSEFVRGRDCSRRVWLDRNRQDLRVGLSLADQDKVETGKRVGKLAHDLYPEGIYVQNPGLGDDASFEATQSLLTEGKSCLFEATIISDGKLARIDVLNADGNGGWVIDEVKSSTIKEPKDIADDKVYDLAFQLHVASKAGLNISAARLVLMDSGYVWNGGHFVASEILGTVNLTEVCHSLQTEIESSSSSLIEVLKQREEPEAELNTHCKKCDYFKHCHQDRPKNDLIFLPRITSKVVTQLREKGYDKIEDLPETEKLTESRKRMRDVILTGSHFVGEGLQKDLETISFPAAFIDYESSNPGFPMYEGTRPFQQVCFQWSAHILDSPTGEPNHFDFLPTDSTDPRIEFCRTLWEAIAHSQTIVHYTGFEITQLRAMVKDEIPLAAELLNAIETRSVDLHKIVSDHTYFEGFRGRTSIKVVLPTLVPSMSYKDLMIADGAAAASGFRRMLSANTSPDEANEIRKALLEYCCQDTLAMVKIYWALRVHAKLDQA